MANIFDLVVINVLENVIKEIDARTNKFLEEMCNIHSENMLKYIYKKFKKLVINGNIEFAIGNKNNYIIINASKLSENVVLQIVPPADTIVDEYRAILECIMLRKNNISFVRMYLDKFCSSYKSMRWVATISDIIICDDEKLMIEIYDNNDGHVGNINIVNLYGLVKYSYNEPFFICYNASIKGETFIVYNDIGNVFYNDTKSPYYFLKGSEEFIMYFAKKFTTIVSNKFGNFIHYNNTDIPYNMIFPIDPSRSIITEDKIYVVV